MFKFKNKKKNLQEEIERLTRRLDIQALVITQLEDVAKFNHFQRNGIYVLMNRSEVIIRTLDSYGTFVKKETIELNKLFDRKFGNSRFDLTRYYKNSDCLDCVFLIKSVETLREEHNGINEVLRFYKVNQDLAKNWYFIEIGESEFENSIEEEGLNG
jgi:hypothetical protein